MKRFLALSLILGVTSFGLIGCGEEPKPEEKSATTAPEGAPAEPKTGEAPGAATPAPAPTTEAPK